MQATNEWQISQLAKRQMLFFFSRAKMMIDKQFYGKVFEIVNAKWRGKWALYSSWPVSKYSNNYAISTENIWERLTNLNMAVARLQQMKCIFVICTTAGNVCRTCKILVTFHYTNTQQNLTMLQCYTPLHLPRHDQSSAARLDSKVSERKKLSLSVLATSRRYQ